MNDSMIRDISLAEEGRTSTDSLGGKIYAGIECTEKRFYK